MLCFFSDPIVYFVPINFYNNLNKNVEIKTSLNKPFDSVSADPRSAFRYTLRALSPARVILYAVEKDTRKRVLVNGRESASLLPQISVGRFYKINITAGKILLY